MVEVSGLYAKQVFDMYTTLGGRVTCTQCNALSKRTRQRCKAPAIKGKNKCRFHGGRSTGPKTAEGKAAIAQAHTVHGRETRAIRAERSAKLAELYELEMLGRKLGIIEESFNPTKTGSGLSHECPTD